MPAAEQRSLSILLDAIQGWGISYSSGLHATADGALTLQPLPGEGTLLADAQAMTEAGMTCPGGIASDGCGNLLVVDAAGGGIYRMALGVDEFRERAIARIDGVGGGGEAPRNFNAARGIAVRPGGGFVVADSGNGRVQSFTEATYALTEVWQDLTSLRGAGPDDPPAQLAMPWSVAINDCSVLFVVDRGNRVVHRIDPRARRLANLGVGALVDPTRVALARDGIVAVADPGAGSVFLFQPGETAAFDVVKPPGQVPHSVAFGGDGTLYVGDEIGLVHVFVSETVKPHVYRPAGSGDSRMTGRILDLVCAGDDGLIALIESGDDVRRGIWRIFPDGGFVEKGLLVTTAIDSDIEQCVWHRIVLAADFQAGRGQPPFAGVTQAGVASIEIATYTSADTAATDQLIVNNAVPWRVDLLSGDRNPDCLVQSEPGRFLWLRLAFGSNGRVSPRLTGARVQFPRRSYLEHLPAIFQDDQHSALFLERFLSIFQSGFDDLDQRIDELWMLFDPASTRAAFLPWLASWVGLVIDPDWTPEELRDRIREAFARHLVRGTPKGIAQAIDDYVDLPTPTRVLEHFRLRDWSIVSPEEPGDDRPFWTGVAALDGTRRLWSRSIYKRLQLDAFSQIGAFRLIDRPEPAVEPLDWGAHRFTVFFPADPNDEDTTRKRVAAVVEREKPAHTEAELCAVHPRMRVGRQAMIGVDARIGEVSYLTLNRLATLGYDTILGCSPFEHSMRESGASPRPRVGATTVLQ